MQALGADVAGAALMRSLLFVPGDSERKLARATTAGADALIVDLEDAVARSELPRARVLACEYIAAGEHRAIWVRINPIDTADAGADLEAVLPSRPAGIVLPKPRGVGDAGRLGGALDALEQEHGLEAGGTAILPIVT
ncbi:MAG: aldolase/citrate lyase family protein, partial [Steroidobacteraceae bacterium]